MSKLVGTIACGLIVMLAADAQAQRLLGRNRQVVQAQQAQPAQTTQVQGQAAGQQAFQPTQQTDAQIAAMLNVGNHVEIALSQLAEQKGSSDEFKKLAREMINEHTQFTEQLNRFANAGAPAQPAMGQHLPMLQIGQQIGEQCIQSATRELQEKRGADFDKCFSGIQMGAHMATIDKMHVLRNYASPQLQQVLAQGEQTAQHHFDQWKQFMQKAEKDNTGGNRNP